MRDCLSFFDPPFFFFIDYFFISFRNYAPGRSNSIGRHFHVIGNKFLLTRLRDVEVLLVFFFVFFFLEILFVYVTTVYHVLYHI